jgi:hypothetical protein
MATTRRWRRHEPPIEPSCDMRWSMTTLDVRLVLKTKDDALIGMTCILRAKRKRDGNLKVERAMRGIW